MQSFMESLANAERLDLAEIVARPELRRGAALTAHPEEFPILSRLSKFPLGDRSLLEHACPLRSRPPRPRQPLRPHGRLLARGNDFLDTDLH